MNTHPESHWTDERVELLQKLWTDGLSANQIAKQLGGVTRNAVIGKVRRLGLQGRASASRPARIVYRIPRPAASPAAPHSWAPKAAAPSPAPVAAVVVPFEPPIDPTGLDPLPEAERPHPAHFCRWPIGDPLSDDFGFCGREQGWLTELRRDPYCEAHRKAERERKKPANANDLAKSLRRYL